MDNKDHLEYLPLLIPLQPEAFFSQVRGIVREEIRAAQPKKQAPTEEDLLTRKEIALYLKISLVTLNDWMKKRGLPFHKKRRGPRFLKSEVLAWYTKKKDAEKKS